jgi:CheY-like chemotaxis protein
MKTNLETLIVDDDKLTLHYIQNIVKESKLEGPVKTSTNGKEALEILDHAIDSSEKVLVLLDINMPVMDGWVFLDKLQDKPYKDKIQVVIVSSSKDPADKKKSNDFSQVIGFLEKPVSPNVFVEIFDLFDSNIVIRANSPSGDK